MKATAKTDTWLKTVLAQAADLSPAQLLRISKDQELAFEDPVIIQGHWRAELRLDGQDRVGYLFADHFTTDTPVGEAHLTLNRSAIPYDRYGCPQGILALHQGGKPIRAWTVISGAPGTDPVFPSQDYPGSLRPCPEGHYTVGEIVEGNFGGGLGDVVIELHPKSNIGGRDALLIHPDYNWRHAPGTAGCIAPANSVREIWEIVDYIRRYKPKTLTVDWGFGTI
ncbi:MAG: L,D-transpeptidase [Acaryochloridaceae cyanobacterium SU_2_1]|nr:L,D-transpeptidase [Acaryochloridaceae cyanobacterium SU_2_1]